MAPLWGAKKAIFTAYHSGKLKLVFTSPDVISTSPQNFLTGIIDYTVLLLLEFLKKHHEPNNFTAKSTSPGLSDTNFFVSCLKKLFTIAAPFPGVSHSEGVAQEPSSSWCHLHYLNDWNSQAAFFGFLVHGNIPIKSNLPFRLVRDLMVAYGRWSLMRIPARVL